jgi:hypothetical protein
MLNFVLLWLNAEGIMCGEVMLSVVWTSVIITNVVAPPLYREESQNFAFSADLMFKKHSSFTKKCSSTETSSK